MPHFFINTKNINNDYIIISDKETFKHITVSLRIKINEKLLFIDENEIQYETNVENINKSTLKVKILKKYKSEKKLPFEIYLGASILKPERQLLALQKATELGIKRFYPIFSDNCAIKKESADQKQGKWQKISNESAKQCERADLMQVFEITSIEKLINKNFQTLVLAEKYTNLTLQKFLSTNQFKNEFKNKKILILTGPEGGFSKKEFDFFKKNNITLITLGNLIYRSDTAICVGLGNLIQKLTDSEI